MVRLGSVRKCDDCSKRRKVYAFIPATGKVLCRECGQQLEVKAFDRALSPDEVRALEVSRVEKEEWEPNVGDWVADIRLGQNKIQEIYQVSHATGATYWQMANGQDWHEQNLRPATDEEKFRPGARIKLSQTVLTGGGKYGPSHSYNMTVTGTVKRLKDDYLWIYGLNDSFFNDHCTLLEPAPEKQ